jgi:AsmA protein
MKKLFITIVVLIALAFGGLFALAKLAPVERIKAEIKVAVKEKTGRDLDFSDAEIVFWPNIGVSLKNVTFGNAAWGQEKNMATLGAMDVSLAVMPLLERRVEVKKFILQEPVIHLEKSKDGTANWDFGSAVAASDKKESGGASAADDMSFSFSKFEIKNGSLTYADRATGTVETVSGLDVVLDFPSLDAAMKVDAGMIYNGRKLALKADIEEPKALLAGKASKGSAVIRTDDMVAELAGALATSGTFLRDGTIKADISSLSKLAAWAGGKAEEKLPFEKVSFQSAATLTDAKLVLTKAALKLDEVEASGDVTVGYAGAKPDIHARLTVNKLNLDRFVAGDAAAVEKPVPSGASGDDWDTAPIDFSGLNAVNADLVLKTGGFSLKGTDVGASTLTAVLKDGALKASSSEASLFGGIFSSDIALNASSALSLAFKMAGVQAKPVLTTFADFEKLSGTADATVNVTSSGKSQKDIVGNLSGQGSAVFKNGSLTGIDVVNIAKMLQSKLDNMGVGEGKTDFVELGGTFTITRGVAHNEDLKMRGPLVQLTGKGDVDLPKKYVAYRIIPVLTASSGVDDAKGLKVPVDIKGKFSDIKIRPDYAGMIRGVLENPEELKSTLKSAKEQGKALEQNLRELKKDPEKALGNLLGGGGLFGKKPAAAPVVAPAEASGAIAPEAAPQAAPEAVPAPEPVAAPEAFEPEPAAEIAPEPEPEPVE